MRILFCNAPSVILMGECGGVRKLMQLYEEGLRAEGHEVEYLPMRRPPDWTTYDVCHLFAADGGSFSIGLEARRHLPLVVSPIIDKTHPSFLMRLNVLLDRYLPVVYTHLGRCATLCRMADAVCLMSTDEGRLTVRGLGVGTPAMPVHAAVSAQTVEPQPGRFKGYSEKRYLLFLGDAGNPRKNVERLISAVRGLNAELLIAGTISQGETGDKVRKMAAATANVRTIGLVSEEEKVFLLRHARAFALPSLMEGIGLAAAEAALEGTTIVITKHGGPPDYFGDRAYYVSPRSVRDIRNQLAAALAEPLNAAARIRERFTLEATGKSLEACYRRCIDHHRNIHRPQRRPMPSTVHP